MIINLHRVNTTNVGDLACAPVRHIPELSHVTEMDLNAFNPSELGLEAADRWYTSIRKADIIIVGGGGLLGIDFFSKGLREVFANKSTSAKTVLWGAGHNSWTISDWRELKFRIDLSDLPFDLVGVRDDNQGLDWVPCSSCLAPEFDRCKLLRPEREIGLYVHEDSLRNENFRRRLPTGIPTLDNNATFASALDFIATSSLLLTDSYHGAYWATLIGRKVIAFPSSSKFYDLKHAVPLCAPEDWRRSAKLAAVYPEALEDCRAANLAFYHRVRSLME